MYEVIHYFTDLQDSKHPYNVGDIFPREGMAVDENRLRELSGNGNRQKKPLIRKVNVKEGNYGDDSKSCGEQKNLFGYTKTDINRMPISELQKLSEEHGVENAKGRSGGELKKLLIEKFSL